MAIKYKLPNNLLNRIVGCPAQTVPSDSVAAAQARKEARDQYRAVLHNLEKCGLVDKHVRVNWERSVARQDELRRRLAERARRDRDLSSTSLPSYTRVARPTETIIQAS